ncbi:CdaR family protein [Paenibacillus gansuensis]|uniref:YbbR-like domain-containing protein n=1 Tax=Paenibacillus gansuensis TaxID=306542 RepID=A0ABW5P691_9BACL
MMDKWLENSTVVKITALVLGVLLWMVVHFNQQNTSGPQVPAVRTDTVTDVAISTVGIDADQYYVSAIEPSKVTLRLRGKQSALARVSPGDTRVELNLSGVDEGVHTLPLKGIIDSSGVSILEILPSHVTVRVEAVQKKEMPVEIQWTGSPADGFKAGEAVITPSKVYVSAPSSRQELIASVRGTVDLSGADEAIQSRQVKLSAYDRNGHKVDAIITPSVVEVEVPITSPLKMVPLQVKLSGRMPDGYSIASLTPNVDHVTVYGPQEYLNTLELYDGLQMDLTKLQLTKDTKVKLEIPLLPGADKIEPASVEYDIRVVPSAERTIKQVPVTIIGANDEFITSIREPEGSVIDVTVVGAPDLVGALTQKDIQAIANVTDLPPGTHTVPVMLNLPSLIYASSDYSGQAKIEIRAKKVAANPSVPAVKDQTPDLGDTSSRDEPEAPTDESGAGNGNGNGQTTGDTDAGTPGDGGTGTNSVSDGSEPGSGYNSGDTESTGNNANP